MEKKPDAVPHASDKNDQVEFEFELLPFRKYKDGRIERLAGEEFVPPSDDLDGVSSKDVVIDPTTGVSARIYRPLDIVDTNEGGAKRLPIVVYYHGGGFCVDTPFSPVHHGYLISLVSKAKILAVSVHYRRATEHMLPAAYDDCWAALQWVLSHAGADGSDAWLNLHGDLNRVYLAGDSSGANIAHNVAMRFGEGLRSSGTSPCLEGIFLEHPYFWGKEKLPEELEKVKPEWLEGIDKAWPLVSGLDLDHPWLNPAVEGAPSMAGLGCRRALVVVAEKDPLRARGGLYYDNLVRSGWDGAAEFRETEGEAHVFHIYNPTSDKTNELMDKLSSFFNGM